VEGRRLAIFAVLLGLVAPSSCERPEQGAVRTGCDGTLSTVAGEDVSPVRNDHEASATTTSR